MVAATGADGFKRVLGGFTEGVRGLLMAVVMALTISCWWQSVGWWELAFTPCLGSLWLAKQDAGPRRCFHQILQDESDILRVAKNNASMPRYSASLLASVAEEEEPGRAIASLPC